MLKINNKPVLAFTYRVCIEDKGCLSNIWKEVHSCENVYGVLDYWTNINKNIINAKNALVPSGTLYFGKTSKFPRFKLQDTPYKRCIKVEKADNVILGKIEVYNIYDNVTLYQDEEYIYWINISSCRLVGSTSALNEFKVDPVQYIKDNQLFYGSNFEFLYKGGITIFTLNNYTDVVKIMDNTYSNIVTDDVLDNTINKNFESITEDDLTAIEDMLDSDDKGTVAIGLKMLSGYNINEVPLTINLILSLRSYLSNCSAWTSVGVKQVLQSIYFSGFRKIERTYVNKDMFKQTTDKDRELFKKIYVRELKKYIDKFTLVYIEDNLQVLGLNFTYDIS